ncbi:hypothetical protein [Streptomyces goshikiensis]|uniref:hypothetical protein n=1 Tax=Streptomyces goshikiensis TaxID=1942 RepID=UPI0036DBEF15
MGDTQEAAGERLLQTLRSMKAYDPAGDYYALTLGANRRGGLSWSAQTHWVGFSERNPRWEIRAACLVDPEFIRKAWTAGTPWSAGRSPKTGCPA